MLISTYLDTASHYGLVTDDGRDDNSFLCEVPEEILREYYESIKEEYNNIPFENFIMNYDHDDMEGLFGFIKERNGNLDCVDCGKEIA